jgi:hypothetical protein
LYFCRLLLYKFVTVKFTYLLVGLVGWLIYFTSYQHNNGYIDGGSQRTIFPGGHPSNY